MADRFDPEGKGYYVEPDPDGVSPSAGRILSGTRAPVITQGDSTTAIVADKLVHVDGERTVVVTVYWSSGRDLDICAWTSLGASNAGYANGGGGRGDGWRFTWDGDNTSQGGSETVRLTLFLSEVAALRKKNCVINLRGNYFGEAGGGVSVVATDFKGRSLSKSFGPSSRKGEKATGGDPGVSFTVDLRPPNVGLLIS